MLCDQVQEKDRRMRSMSSSATEDSSPVAADVAVAQPSCSTGAALEDSVQGKSAIDVLTKDIFLDLYPSSLEGSDRQEAEACMRKVTLRSL